jgi:hypothetical protein
MRKLAIFATLSLAFAAACGEDNPVKKDAAVVSDAPVDSGVGDPDASCFTDPHTNNEIINACTTAQKIYVPGHPALQLPDGGLPALP